MKHSWSALLVIIGAAIVYRLLETIIPANLSLVLVFVYCVLLLVIGSFLFPGKRKNNRWFGKVVIALVVVFIIGMRLDVLVVDELNQLLNLVGLNGVFLDLILVYCGWAFFQV